MVSTPFESTSAADLDNLKEIKTLSPKTIVKVRSYRWEEKLGRFVEAKTPATL
jgi:hypothetical protein